MTIEAELPDGRILEFPDGTDHSVIDKTVQGLLGVDKGDFVRGFESLADSDKEVLGGMQTLLGAGAKHVLGQGVVSDYLLGKGAKNIHEANEAQQREAKKSDDLQEAWKQGIGTVVTDWLPYQVGQGMANIMETGAFALAGGLLGSAVAPGAGTAAGAMESVVNRSLVRKGIKEAAEKILQEQLASGATKEEAKKATADYVAAHAIDSLNGEELSKLAKSGAAAYGQNLGMAGQAVFHGTGETTSRALQEAGYDPEQIDMSRLAPAVAVHSLADYAGEKIGLGGLSNIANKSTRNLLLDVGKGMLATGAKEVPAEELQQAAERYGAGLSVNDKDAINEYINTAGGAFVMGAVPGGVGGIRTRMNAPAIQAPAEVPLEVPQQEIAPPEAPPPAAPLALGMNKPFTPQALPDGSVALTQADLDAYNQSQFEAKYAPQPNLNKAEVAATPPQLGYSPLAGVPKVMPSGQVALNEQQEFEAKYAPQKVRMTQEKWASMSPEEQEAYIVQYDLEQQQAINEAAAQEEGKPTKPKVDKEGNLIAPRTPEEVWQAQGFEPKEKKAPGPFFKASEHPLNVGKDNVLIKDGGVPFDNPIQAKAAQKLNPTMKMIKVAGKFVLSPKTQAELDREAKSQIGLPMTASGEPIIGAKAFVASRGGLHTDEMANMNYDKNEQVGNRPLFRPNGFRMDQVTEALHQAGYIQNEDQAEARQAIATNAVKPEDIEKIGGAYKEQQVAEEERQFEADKALRGPVTEDWFESQTLPELYDNAQTLGINPDPILTAVRYQHPQEADYQREGHNALMAAVRDKLHDRVETLKSQSGEGTLKSKTGAIEQAPKPTSEQAKIQKELTGKSMVQVAQWAINNAPNKFTKFVMQKVLNRIQALAKEGVTYEFEIQDGDQRNSQLFDANGVTTFYWGQNGDHTHMRILLNGHPVVANQLGYPSGMSYKVVMHELLHVATRGQLRFLKSTDPLVKELATLYNQVVRHYNAEFAKNKGADLPLVIQEFMRGKNNALSNMDELVSWGMTDEGVQKFLNDIKVGEKTVFNHIVSLIRELLGIAKPFETALDKLVSTTDSIVSSDLVDLKNGMIKQSYALGKAKKATTAFTQPRLEGFGKKEQAKQQQSLFGETEEEKNLAHVKENLVRFASGMSGISDLENATRARSGHTNHGIGVDVGLISQNAINQIAHTVLNMKTPVFVDSGAFSNFRQQLKGNKPKPLDFDAILAKYDAIEEAIQRLNDVEESEYPRPLFVMPDIVGDQKASLDLIDKHKNWIQAELNFNISRPIIPIQKGAMSLADVYKHLVKTLGTDNFIVGIPSNEKAVSRADLDQFLKEVKPKAIHFLGAASDTKLNPLLHTVALLSPDTNVTADASQVRSSILNGVAQGKSRPQAIMDALYEHQDPQDRVMDRLMNMPSYQKYVESDSISHQEEDYLKMMTAHEAGRVLGDKVQQALQKRSPMNVDAFAGVDPKLTSQIQSTFYAPNKTILDRVVSMKGNFWNTLAQKMVDELRTVKDYSPIGYMQARLSKATDGALEGILHYGHAFLDDGALNIKTGDNHKGLMQALAPLGKEVDRFQVWMALNREANLPDEKRSPNLSSMVSQRNDLIKGDLNGVSRAKLYEQARKDMMAINKSVLDVALDTGTIDKEAYERFANDAFYIPFYRAMEDGKIESIRAASRLTNQQFSKMLKGQNEKPFGDLMENVMRNWSHILSASMKNQAAVTIIQDASGQGAVTPNLKPGLYWADGAVHSAESGKIVGNGDVVQERVDEDGKKYLVSMTDSGKDTVKVLINGKDAYFHVNDPMLLESIGAITYLGPQSKVLDVMRNFKNYLRFGVTLSPAFKASNLIKDSIQSAGLSGLSNNFVKNVYDGFADSKPGSATYIAALAGGGVFNYGTTLEGDRSQVVKKLLASGVNGENIVDTKEKVEHFLKKLWHKYEEIGNRSENINRIALYKKLRAEGKTHLEASFEARDLMDFSMSGSSGAIRYLSQIVPFLNARLQGLYKLGRDGINPTVRVFYNTATGKPIIQDDIQKAKSFSTVAGAVTLASMALYMAFKDDEDFKKREQWDRDFFWWFKIPGTNEVFRIPKPFEFGSFGTLAERSLEQIVDKGVEGKVFGDSIQRMVFQTFSMNPTPQFFKPLVDVYANKDSFTNAPIETAGMERLSKQERVSNDTSAIAKALGGVSHVFAPIAGTELSPVQIDYMIRGYMGWLGGTIETTSQYAMMPFNDGVYPDADWTKRMSLGFVQKLPATQSTYVTDFYQNNQRISESYADMRHYAELGQSEKVKEILTEKKDDIALAKLYDKTAKDIASIRKQKLQIANPQNRSMTGEQKQQEIQRLDLLISQVAQHAEEIRKSLKKAP